jgi:hypothetical protein
MMDEATGMVIPQMTLLFLDVYMFCFFLHSFSGIGRAGNRARRTTLLIDTHRFFERRERHKGGS